MRYIAYIDVHFTDMTTLGRTVERVEVERESPYIKDNAMNTAYFVHRALLTFCAKNPETIIYQIDVINLTPDEKR